MLDPGHLYLGGVLEYVVLDIWTRMLNNTLLEHVLNLYDVHHVT